MSFLSQSVREVQRMRLAGWALLVTVILPMAKSARCQDPPAKGEVDEQASLDAVAVAFKSQRWEEVVRIAEKLRGSLKDPVLRFDVCWMAAHAEARREAWDSCLNWCGAIEKEGSSAGSHLPPDRASALLIDLQELKACAYLGLGKGGLARETLVRAAEGLPIGKRFEWKALLAATLAKEGFLVDENYSGKYGEDFRLPKAIDRVKKALPEAVKRIQRRLGPGCPSFPPVVVCIADEEGSGRRSSACSISYSRADSRVGVVWISSEALVTRSVEEVMVLSHELTHLLEPWVPGSSGWPHWLQEGIAHWVECEDESWHEQWVIEAALSMEEQDAAPQPPLRTIFDDYMRVDQLPDLRQRAFGSIILFHLERVRGTDAVRKLILRLLKEKDGVSALCRETGKSMQDLLQEVQGEYLEWCGKKFPGFEVVNEAGKLFKSGKLKEAIAAIDAFLAANPSSPLATWVELERASFLGASGNPREGVAALRSLRSAHPTHRRVPASVVEEIRTLATAEHWSEILAVGPAYVRDYLYLEGPSRKSVEDAIGEARKHLDEKASPPVKK